MVMWDDVLNQPEAKDEHLGCDSGSNLNSQWGFQRERMSAEALTFDVNCCILAKEGEGIKQK